MSTVTPPPPPPPPVVQSVAQPTAVVSNPPTGLTSVAAGTRIDAIIVATTPDGRVEVETKLGRFLMQPNVTLPKDGPIQLQIQTLARHLFVIITSIHGKVPQAALRGLGLPGTPVGPSGQAPGQASVQTSAASIGAAAPASASAPNTTPAGILAASGSASAAGSASASATASTLAGGALTPAGSASLTAGATVVATVLKPARPGIPAANAAANPSNASVATTPGRATGAPPPPVVQSVAQPTAVVSNPPPGLTSVAAGTRIDAIIVATTPDGRVEVETRLGRFLMQPNVTLPKDGPIQLQIQTLARHLFVIITSIHGKAPQAALRGLGLPGTPVGPPGQAPGQALGQASVQTSAASIGAAAPASASAPNTTPAGILAASGSASAAGSASATASTLAGGALTPAGSASFTAGATVVATVLKPARPGTPAANAAANPSNASVATTPGRATGAPTGAPPGVASGSASGAAPLSRNAGGVPISGAQATAAYGGQSVARVSPSGVGPSGHGLIPSGNAFMVKITALAPPAPGGTPPGASSGAPVGTPAAASAVASTGATATLRPGQTLNGIISTSPSPNTTVIQTHAGPISLNAPARLPVGTSVQFNVLEQLPPRGDGIFEQAGVKRISTFLLQSRSWPAFEEAVGALRASNPQAAMQLINSALPRPNSALAANIMKFLLGIRSGELAGWMGDNAARLLLRDRPDLMNRMRDEFRAMGRMSEEPVSGEWRALPIPLANGAEIQQIQLLMRRINDDEDDDENPDQGPGTRFIVDVDLSRMGRIQLDGFVQDDSKRFDLIIRSKSRMADHLQNGIRAIFEDAQELTGMTGGLRFQAAPPKFIDAFDDTPNGEIGLMV